jgi:hypothetical protein
VLGEEGGGWLGGFGGSALGAGACIAFGIVTEGVGLLLCGAVGGIGGGLAGAYLGGELGEALGGGFGGGPGGLPDPTSAPQVMTRIMSTSSEWDSYEKARQMGIAPF